MTLRLDIDTLRRLDGLAEVTSRSKAWRAAQAVKDYLELNEWQTRGIEAAVKRADCPSSSPKMASRLSQHRDWTFWRLYGCAEAWDWKKFHIISLALISSLTGPKTIVAKTLWRAPGQVWPPPSMMTFSSPCPGGQE